MADTKRPTTGGCAWAHLPGDTGKPWVNNPAASWNHLGFEQDDDHPVVCVTWDDTQDYVKWLSQHPGILGLSLQPFPIIVAAQAVVFA